jgi:hypothetical protein
VHIQEVIKQLNETPPVILILRHLSIPHRIQMPARPGLFRQQSLLTLLQMHDAFANHTRPEPFRSIERRTP